MPGGTSYRDRYLVGSSPAPITGFPVSQTVLVDPSNPQADDSSGLDLPFVTIQAALDAIGTPSDLADQKVRWTIQISSGQYDEDLSVPASRRITLLPFGPVTLGDGAANVNFGSTTPRSITVDGTPAFGGRSAFSIGTILPGCIYGDNCTQATAFDVSGDVNLVGAGMALGTEQVARFMMTRVRGQILGVAGSLCDLHFSGSRIDGGIDEDGGALAIIHANRSYFPGALDVALISHASLCKFEDDITVSLLPTVLGLDSLPPGFYNCSFNNGVNTFSGPPTSLFLDSASNYFFKASGWVLGGGATKTIINDATP